MAKDRWKAVRKGEIYCAPACGRGCTYKEYLQANKRADALVKKCEREIGGKWKKLVHENLGWHYRVSLKDADITVHENDRLGDARYSIMSHRGGTPSVVFIKTWSKSIKWLVMKQLAAVQHEADRWSDYIKRNRTLKP